MSFKSSLFMNLLQLVTFSEWQRVTPRSEIVSMFSVVWKKFIQNITRIVRYVRKKIVVHVSSELGRCKIVSCIEANSRIERRTVASRRWLIGRAGITHGRLYNSIYSTDVHINTLTFTFSSCVVDQTQTRVNDATAVTFFVKCFKPMLTQ